MRSLMMALVAIGALVLGSCTAWAQGAAQPNTDQGFASSLPVAISVTPRVWFRQSNINTNTPDYTQSTTMKQNSMQFYGLSIGIAPRAWSQVDFLVNGYIGAGNSNGYQIINNYSQDADYFHEKLKIERTDLEFLVRNKIPESYVNLVGGVRWMHFSDTTELLSCGWASNDPCNNPIFTSTGTNSMRSDSDALYVEAGINMAVPIRPESHHALFGGATIGYGIGFHDFCANCLSSFKHSTAEANGLLDVNFGYQYQISSNFSASARYRVMIDYSDPTFFTHPQVIQGPEIGFTARF